MDNYEEVVNTISAKRWEMASTVVTITLTHSTGNVLVHLPHQVVSRTGSEERVGCPNHKGVLVAAGTKQRRQTSYSIPHTVKSCAY